MMYHYDRYSVVEAWGNEVWRDASWPRQSYGTRSLQPTKPLWDSDKYVATSSTIDTDNGWTISNGSTERTISHYSSPQWDGYGYVWSVDKFSRKLEKQKGSLLQSKIKAPNGSYPYNGIHTDGYWYVKTGIANEDPILSLSTFNNQLLSLVLIQK